MEHRTAKVIDGWLVCSCGRKLAQVDGKTVRILCRGNMFTGTHCTIIAPEGVIDDACNCDSDCNSADLN